MGEVETERNENYLPGEKDCCGSEMTSSSTFQWNADKDLSESLKVLDPDDPLMRRFQNALKAHLTRINNKLEEDIVNLEKEVHGTKKEREVKAARLYSSQAEISRQQECLEKYETKLAELAKFREEKESEVDETKDLRRMMEKELDVEKNMGTKLTGEMDRLNVLSHQFAEWEEEIENHTKISKRMTEKEATMQRELLRKKQEEDYVLMNLMEEVSRLENEIKESREQLGIKEKERVDANETITDANTDLEGLQRSQKKLIVDWNHVLVSISQRDKFGEELLRERRKIRESLATLAVQTEKLKRDTNSEMENNEKLTSVQSRLENDIQYNFTVIADDKSIIDNVERKLLETTKLLDGTQNEFDTACWELERLVDEEKTIDKEIENLMNSKNELEERVLLSLETKVSRDKCVKSLDRELRELREKLREEELAMLQTENLHGRNVLELEELNGHMSTEKSYVEDLTRINREKEKELDGIENELKKYDFIVAKKQQKIVSLNKIIEERISTTTGGEEISPQDFKMKELEKKIEETEADNRKSQELWLRQEGYMVTLSEERSTQLREMNLLGKQITLMEQKSLKLEREIEAQKREEENICRNVKILQQKLISANERLAARREARDDLEDKNCIAKNECIEALRKAEIELIKLQNDIKELITERKLLTEQLRAAQRETLSWEKKVKLACETRRKIKEENSEGGDVALMKSEIHKMEMRLSHLRKAQEKMIRDMEYCVARRDVIIDGALAREKRNPKGLHNQRVIFEKRINDQKLKIKQINKETKQMENQILELEDEQKRLLERLNENQKTLRAHEDEIPDINKQINEGELMKYHKLECLVRKQRKVRMLQDVKEGRYKMLFKSEMSLNDELHKQRAISMNLKEIMEEAHRDFPLLKDGIRKVILGME